MNITKSAYHMNIVYWIYIHEVLMIYDCITLSSIFLLNGKDKRNDIILCMHSFPTAYSNYSLMEIILIFNSVMSGYVMSNC